MVIKMEYKEKFINEVEETEKEESILVEDLDELFDIRDYVTFEEGYDDTPKTVSLFKKQTTADKNRNWLERNKFFIYLAIFLILFVAISWVVGESLRVENYYYAIH